VGRARLFFALASVTLSAADPDYQSAEAKLDRIANYRLKAGETVVFTPRETNAWARVAVPENVPQGIRDPRVELGFNTANGLAYVDLLKMLQEQGKPANPLMGRFLEGERLLKISVRVESAGGRCTVYLTRVDLGDISAEGPVLDLLLRTFFLPRFPDAKIGEPFDIGWNLDRIEVRSDGIRVTAKQ